MKRTSAAQVIIQALWPGPGPEIFEIICALVSAPRAELFTYASRSATRCSSDGEDDGKGLCAFDRFANANKTNKTAARMNMSILANYSALTIDSRSRVWSILIAVIRTLR